MPVYEFKCGSCGRVFGELRKLGDYGNAACPDCGARDCEKVFSLFSGGKGGKDKCGSCSHKPAGGCSACH